METVFLFTGVLIGGGVFAATLFSAAQVLHQNSRLRYAHIASVVITVGAMAALSLEAAFASQILGFLLIIPALRAFWLELRWNKVLPIFQVLFGGALLAALPFAG